MVLEIQIGCGGGEGEKENTYVGIGCYVPTHTDPTMIQYPRQQGELSSVVAEEAERARASLPFDGSSERL